MPSCVFRKCRNYFKKVGKEQGITYHVFPTDEVFRQEWIAVVRKQRSEFDWMPSKSSKVCSVHFKSDDKYISKKGLILIKKSAIPIIEEYEVPIIPGSPTSLDNVSVADMDEILETPRIAALKRRVNKLTFEKKQLQKRNKMLIQRNKRLKNKIAKMGEILETLSNLTNV